MRTSLIACALLFACSSEPTKVDAGADQPLPPASKTFGEDHDARATRTLDLRCPLPEAYATAIASSGLGAKQIAQPDLGLTFAVDPQRLHWTDALRAAPEVAPSFACMAASDVERAVKGARPLPDLLAAQGLYGAREGYVLSRFDRAYTVPLAQSSELLLAALRRFHERPLLEGDPRTFDPWSAMEGDARAQVATLSEGARAALAAAIAGLLDAADLRDRALTEKKKLSIADWSAKSKAYMTGRRQSGAAFQSAYDAADAMTEAMDWELLSRSAQLAARALESLRVALAEEEPKDGAGLDLTGPLGRLVVSLGASDDAWSGDDFFLLVDRAGNDRYADNIAVNKDLFHPIAGVLDIGGDDSYLPTKVINPVMGSMAIDRGQGTGQAAGWFGVAILDDGGGKDRYNAGYYQAFGTYGVGALVDHGGDDVYEGYNRSQGAADLGFGLLLDLGGGNDRYETLHNSQGFGGVHGIGWLVDDGGDDRYLAITQPINDPLNNPYNLEGSNFSGAQGYGWGLRAAGGLSGGMGALFDLGGDDRYECAVMCQAFGYFFGTGLLYDKAGDDTYITWHKYGMGGATHQANAVFLDMKGTDSYEYTAGGIPTNGGSEGLGLGYDMGIGFHIDRGPEPDTYTFKEDKQQLGEVVGIARFVGVGVYLNEGGDDAYHIPGKMGAYALGMVNMPTAGYRSQTASQNTAAVGLFFDLGGNDTYDLTGSSAGNDKSWKQTMASTNTPMDVFDPKLDFGYGIDGQLPWAAWSIP